ncbi:hypothetical protein [Noviherbaspirillum sp. UKPF54]|nr:hypothetical protein [Noviherbaspirillum sp. UKPF54]
MEMPALLAARSEIATGNEKHIAIDLATIVVNQAYGKMLLAKVHCK